MLPLQAVDDLGRCLGSPDGCQLHCVYGFRGVDASRFRVPAKLPMLLSSQARAEILGLGERAGFRVGRAARAQGSGQHSLGRAGTGPATEFD